jgi:hypothetical protein
MFQAFSCEILAIALLLVHYFAKQFFEVEFRLLVGLNILDIENFSEVAYSTNNVRVLDQKLDSGDLKFILDAHIIHHMVL